MPQIVVENLRKSFQVAERQAGLWGALRGMTQRRYRTVTALNDISFTLDAGEPECVKCLREKSEGDLVYKAPSGSLRAPSLLL